MICFNIRTYLLYVTFLELDLLCYYVIENLYNLIFLYIFSTMIHRMY